MFLRGVRYRPLTEYARAMTVALETVKASGALDLGPFPKVYTVDALAYQLVNLNAPTQEDSEIEWQPSTSRPRFNRVAWGRADDTGWVHRIQISTAIGRPLRTHRRSKPNVSRSNYRRRLEKRAHFPGLCDVYGRYGHPAYQCDFLAQYLRVRRYLKVADRSEIERMEQAWLRHNKPTLRQMRDGRENRYVHARERDDRNRNDDAGRGADRPGRDQRDEQGGRGGRDCD